MPGWKWSERSLKNLEGVAPALRMIADEALKISPVDFGVVCGHRGEEEQMSAYREGKSRVKWPNSKHNRIPAEAIDIVTYPDETACYYLVAAIMLGLGWKSGIRLRWGGAWNGRLNEDWMLMDYGHIEIEGECC